MPSVPVDFLALSCFRGICSSFRMRPFSITTSSDLLLRLSLHSSCFSLSFSADMNSTNIPIIVSESVCCLLVCQQSFILYRCCWASVASAFIIQLLGEFPKLFQVERCSFLLPACPPVLDLGFKELGFGLLERDVVFLRWVCFCLPPGL